MVFEFDWLRALRVAGADGLVGGWLTCVVCLGLAPGERLLTQDVGVSGVLCELT